MVRNLFGHLLSSKNYSRQGWFQFSENISMCGRYVSRKLTVLEKVAITNYFPYLKSYCKGYIKSYGRVSVNGRIFCTSSYCRLFKRRDSIASMHSADCIEISSILILKKCNCNIVRLVGCVHPEIGIEL